MREYSKEPQPDKTKIHKDYLWWSIANLLVCFVLAIPAIIFSVRSRRNLGEEEYESAEKNSNRARYFNIIADLMGLIMLINLIFFSKENKNGMCSLKQF